MVYLPTFVASFPFCGVLVDAKPLSKRQTPSSDLQQYIQEVNSALYAAQVIEAGNASALCNLPGFEQSLDSAGYDGQYAELLMSAHQCLSHASRS